MALEVLKQQFYYFGPFLPKYAEIASPETVTAILYVMHEIPKSQTTPLHRTTEEEVCKKDTDFIGKIMMMDWRDRPTAEELLRTSGLRRIERDRSMIGIGPDLGHHKNLIH